MHIFPCFVLGFFLVFAEDHVCDASVESAATLALRKVFFGDGWYEPV